MATHKFALTEGLSQDWRLEDHEASLARLTAVMSRVQATMRPWEFVETVSAVFQELKPVTVPWTSHPDFRAADTFRIFQDSLRLARDRGAKSVLVLGSGEGFAGESADFGLEIARDIFSSTASELMACNVSQAMLRQGPEALFRRAEFRGKRASFDLAVVHSLLHFVPDLGSFFRLTCSFLKPSSTIILAHEPNARFWNNSDCQSAVEGLRVARSKRTWRRHARAIAGFLRFRKSADLSTSIHEKLNRRLMERNVLKSPLLENEIRRIVDVHRPEATPGNFRIGLNGFDFTDIGKAYLPRFEPVWTATSAHLGYTPGFALTEEWRRRLAALAAAHPLAGSILTAVYSTKP